MGGKKKGAVKTLSPQVFTGIYAEIAAQIDSETAVRIHAMLRGQMVSFPQKLYSREHIRAFLRENAGQYTVRELAGMFGYSDRRIRQFIAEEKQKQEIG